jgi:hypothetical protein
MQERNPIKHQQRAIYRMNPEGHRHAIARNVGIVTLPDGRKVYVGARHNFFRTPKGEVTTNPLVATGRVTYRIATFAAAYGGKRPPNTGVTGTWVQLMRAGNMGILHRGMRRDPVTVIRVVQGPQGTRAQVRYLAKPAESAESNPVKRVKLDMGPATTRGSGTRARNAAASKSTGGRSITDTLVAIGEGKARVKLGARGLEVVPVTNPGAPRRGLRRLMGLL